MDKLSYSFGLAIASQLVDMGAEALNLDDFCQAVKDIYEGNDLAISTSEAQKIVTDYLQRQQQAKQEEQEAKGSKAKGKGEAFLQKNAKEKDVVVLPSGLQYTVLKNAEGPKPTAADSVKCHYEGKLIDGTIFDSSIKRGEPAVFPLNGVIRGWTEGLQLMSVGSKFRFFIPYDLAYGANGAGGLIPPYAALIFDVELLSIEK